MRLRKIPMSVLAVFLALSLAGCTTYQNFKQAFFEEKPSEIIKIGVFEPLTGVDAESASDEIKGIELANSLYDSVLNTKVELVYEDNQSEVDAAVAAAQLLADAGVSLVLGSYNSVLSLAGGDVFEEEHIPAIAISCMNPLITQTNDYYFRVCFAEAYQGISAAKYIYESLGRENLVALKMSDDDYAKMMIEQLQAEMQTLTGRTDSVIIVEYPETGDPVPCIERIAANGRRTVFFPSSASTAEKFIRTAREMGYSFDWVGPSRWASISAPNADAEDSSYLDGVAYITDYNPDAELSPMTEIFNDAWREAYGKDSEPSYAAALGFDAYILALEGIKIAGKADDGSLIRKSIMRINNLPGATGVISIGTDGDPIKDVIVVKYSKGLLKSVYTVSSERDFSTREERNDEREDY